MDDRPRVVPDPQERRHREDGDERDDRQIHPAEGERLGIGRAGSRSPSLARTQTGLLSVPWNRTLDYLGTLLCTLSSSIRHGALERYEPDKARHERPSSLCRRKSRGLRSFEKAPFMWFIEQG